MTFLRFDGSADFTIEETATGRMVDFRLTNEETIGREGERSRVFTWRSKGLVDNFEIRVSAAETDLDGEVFDMRAEIIAAAVDRAKLELQDPESSRKTRSSPDTPTMHYDSTGKRLKTGDRILFRGRVWTFTHEANPGTNHTARIKVAEPLHVEEHPDETNVDLVTGTAETAVAPHVGGSLHRSRVDAMLEKHNLPPLGGVAHPITPDSSTELPERVRSAVSRALVGHRLTTKERAAILAAVIDVLNERTRIDTEAPEGKTRVEKERGR